jgi:biopolymer transport protein ExbD
VVAAIPKPGNKYDLHQLSKYLMELKRRYPEKEDVTVLLEPDIPYEDMVHVMDAVRVVEIKQPDQEEAQKIPLFPAISVGDAP